MSILIGHFKTERKSRFAELEITVDIVCILNAYKSCMHVHMTNDVVTAAVSGDRASEGASQSEPPHLSQPVAWRFCHTPRKIYTKQRCVAFVPKIRDTINDSRRQSGR